MSSKQETTNYETPKDLAKHLWKGEMPQREYLANMKWLVNIHKSLNDGGIWFYSEEGLVFTKSGKGFTG